MFRDIEPAYFEKSGLISGSQATSITLKVVASFIPDKDKILHDLQTVCHSELVVIY